MFRRPPPPSRPERRTVVQLRFEPGVGIEPLRDDRENLLSPMHLGLGAKPHALQRPNRSPVSYRHLQRRRQAVQGAGPGDHRPPLDLPESQP